MNIFFTCKNTLVILLQLYRLYVVQSESKSKRKEDKCEKYEIPNISIISRNDMHRGRKHIRFKKDRRRKKVKGIDLEENVSDSDDSESIDRYDLSPKNFERNTR